MKFITSLFFLLFISSIYSQTKNTQRESYKWFDSVIGIENTGLFVGTRYSRYAEKYRTIKSGEHKFLLSSKFYTGNITYDGQPYYDIEIKYDIYQDLIIANLKTHSGNSIIQLLTEKIEKFSLNGNDFIKLSNNNIVNSNDIITGIYQPLYQSSNVMLYKKNKKIAKKHLTTEYIYYTFKNNDFYYLHFNDNFYIINSKKDLIKTFPNYKKDINSFYAKNKILLNSNYDVFITKISSKLSHLIANNPS